MSEVKDRRDGILSRDGMLCGRCSGCLVVCWITGTRGDLVGEEAGNLSGEKVSQGQKLDVNLMAERSWEGFEAGGRWDGEADDAGEMRRGFVNPRAET